MKEVNRVFKTNDLTGFKTIKGNRPPNPQHVKRLAISIQENGLLQNPIIVNEDMEVVDGQHRLMAARKAESSIYFIIVEGYHLQQVQVLNLNQKNWTKKDFMNGYADMGVAAYVKLRDFVNKNNDLNMTDCIAICANNLSSSSSSINQKYRKGSDRVFNIVEIFEEGTWLGGDFDLAQRNADKIYMVKPYYNGYNRSTFVQALLGMFRIDEFDFTQFIKKLSIQGGKLIDCTSVTQYRLLIEEIYNYKSRDKVNLRYT